MNEMNAWEKFTQTGKIEDYLNYCALTDPQKAVQKQKGDQNDAAESGWHRTQPAQFR